LRSGTGILRIVPCASFPGGPSGQQYGLDRQSRGLGGGEHVVSPVRRNEPAGSQLRNPRMTQSFDTLYRAFEDKFRGSPDLIKERLRVYLPLLQQLPADVGRGRRA